MVSEGQPNKHWRIFRRRRGCTYVRTLASVQRIIPLQSDIMGFSKPRLTPWPGGGGEWLNWQIPGQMEHDSRLRLFIGLRYRRNRSEGWKLVEIHLASFQVVSSNPVMFPSLLHMLVLNEPQVRVQGSGTHIGWEVDPHRGCITVSHAAAFATALVADGSCRDSTRSIRLNLGAVQGLKIIGRLQKTYKHEFITKQPAAPISGRPLVFLLLASFTLPIPVRFILTSRSVYSTFFAKSFFDYYNLFFYTYFFSPFLFGVHTAIQSICVPLLDLSLVLPC